MRLVLCAVGFALLPLGMVSACGDSFKTSGGDQSDGDSTSSEATLELSSFCESDGDCDGSAELCDVGRAVCVECLQDTHCGESELCRSFSCVEITPCTTSKQCPTDTVCSDVLGYCVECEGDNDCDEGATCFADACVPSCDSDKDCQSSGEVCLIVAGVCRPCNTAADCAGGEFCDETGQCQERICEDGEISCSEGVLTECGADGDRYESSDCDEGCNADGTACALPCEDGAEGCPCDGEACDDGLECLSGICVDLASGSGGNGSVGGGSGGGNSTGGNTSGTGGGPSSGDCRVLPSGSDVQLGTTGPACFIIEGKVTGWAAYNAEGRSFSVNGEEVAPGAALSGDPPYRIEISAGEFTWASVTYW